MIGSRFRASKSSCTGRCTGRRLANDWYARRIISLARDADERDIVKLGAVGDVALDELDNRLTDGFGTRAGGGDGLAERVVPNTFSGRVHCVGHTVGIEHDCFARFEQCLDHFRMSSQA